MIRGREPARCVLGLAPQGAAAVVCGGRVVALAGANDPWSAALEALASAALPPEEVEQVAVAAPPGPLARRRQAREARMALGSRAGFCGRGLVGTRLPRGWDRRDRVSLHEPARCRAAAAYYTAGVRAALVAVQTPSGLRLWLGTSGKLVSLAPVAPGQVPALGREVGAQRVLADGVAVPGARTPPLTGAVALAAGVALLAWADERQGAWVPAAWEGSWAPG